MGQVVWTEPALADVREIVEYIGKDSPRYATRVADRIAAAPRGLSKHPRSGGRVPEFDLDRIREIIVRPYRIIYEIRGDDCFVVAVIHGSRHIQQLGEPDQNL